MSAITDPIGDFLTRIRNGQLAHHKVVEIPASNMKKRITEILYDQGYILKYKFVDDEGNMFEVEIRGERHEDKVRFRGRDIERVFEMEKLVDDAQKTDRGYVRNEDYEILLVVAPTLSGQLQVESLTQKGHKKRLFFTYQGIIKVITGSRSGVAHKFKDWMTRVVFRAHMGTDWDKAELAYELIDTTDIDAHELVRELQEKLRIKDQQLQERDDRIKASEDHILLLNELLVDNTKIEATQVIYIATSPSYAKQNRFKVGGVESTEKLKGRLSTYNSRSAKGDDFFYSDIFIVANYRQIEDRLKSLMVASETEQVRRSTSSITPIYSTSFSTSVNTTMRNWTT